MTNPASLTLGSILADPASATFPVAGAEHATLSPLLSFDEPALGAFFTGLSPRTRGFYSVTDPLGLARDHCAAIARYDKLRLVLRQSPGAPIRGLVEFSLDLTAGDVARYAGYGVELRAESDCRWGLCVADVWQGRGVGAALAAPSFEIARRFGRSRIILWGGVKAANSTAIRYYHRIGFTETGRFTQDGAPCVDMLAQILN